ncbi:MAG TPA: heme-binding protein [Caulobacteraceae bacterium]|jgi:uncharacterized protein GlcG (DUF336 family)
MRLALPIALIALAAPAVAQQALAQQAPDAGPAPPRVAGPSEDLARQAAETAVKTCERMGYKTMATVVDTTGRPIAAMTADPDLSQALAPGSVKRARVAAYFHTASSDVAQRVGMDTALYYTTHNNPQLASPEPGGVPLSGPDKPRGAIGVAGSPDPAKDEACARAGAQQVANKLK